MQARDKNYNLIELGMYVEVPEREGEHHSFVGSVLCIDVDNYLTVEDMEGDCFAIECELVEIVSI